VGDLPRTLVFPAETSEIQIPTLLPLCYNYQIIKLKKKGYY